MTKAAILIDGGFFLKRFKTVRPNAEHDDPKAVSDEIKSLVRSHLKQLHKIHGGKTEWDLLYRAFYYDARPLIGKAHKPVSKSAIDYTKTSSSKFRNELFASLRTAPNFAVRLGETYAERQWVLKNQAQKDLINGKREWSSIIDDDFDPGIRQKAVDMRLGLDIASITLKRQANIIILVTGDSDFVPAAKLARREGVRVVLDPLWQSVKDELYEHIDGLRSGFPRPGQDAIESDDQ